MISWLKIKELSGVAEARRRARRRASMLGFDSTKVEKVAIVTTEIAQNLLRHADGGSMLMQADGAPGLERLLVLAVDSGPGISRLSKMMKDGESTESSSGTGLGAIKRLADRLDISTDPAEGTVVAAEFFARSVRHADPVDHAALRIAYPGERVCGDGVAIRRARDQIVYFLCDGLGHGAKAGDAANAACAAFFSASIENPAMLLAHISDALKGSRGAVASVVQIDRAKGQLSYAGIGNITTLLLHDRKTRRLPVRDGLLGAQARSPHTETLSIAPDDIIIMHSDGIQTLHGLENRAAFMHRSAPVIAGRLLHEFTRGRDDASIIVSRMTEARTV